MLLETDAVPEFVKTFQSLVLHANYDNPRGAADLLADSLDPGHPDSGDVTSVGQSGQETRRKRLALLGSVIQDLPNEDEGGQ